jgi:hypothetical protein
MSRSVLLVNLSAVHEARVVFFLHNMETFVRSEFVIKKHMSWIPAGGCECLGAAGAFCLRN